MRCPTCNSTQIKVIDTRESIKNSILRRRKCISCGFKWSTREIVVGTDLRLSKKDSLVIDKNRTFVL